MISDYFSMKKREFIILSCITFVALLLRVYLLNTHLFFGPEQGRDFLVIRDIVLNHKWTLIGPKTDIDGIFHGPLFYYLSSIPFFMSHGNPYGVSLFFILIQSFTVFPLFLLVYEFTKSKRAGYIASTFFAVSFGAIVYARWLSNPPLSIPLSVLLFLYLVRFIHGKKWGLVGTVIFYGLLGQVEFINYYIYGILVFMLMWIYRNILFKTKKIIIVYAFFIGVIASFSNYVFFDVRHDYLITQSVLKLLSGRGGYPLPITTSVYDSTKMFLGQYAYAVTGAFQAFGVFLLIVCIGVLMHEMKKNKHLIVLMLWLLIPVVSLSLLRHTMLEQLFVGSIAGYIVLTAVCINWLIDKRHKVYGMGLMCIIIYVNLRAVFNNLPNNKNVFFQSPQPHAYYSDQLKVIDWIHRQSNGRPYAFQVYTIPYYWQDHWDYLFWYKQIKDNIKTTNSERPTITYVISQKDRSNTLFFDTWYSDTISRFGKPVRDFETGVYKVEEREETTL